MMKRPPKKYPHSSVGVHERDIARVEEALLVDGLLGQLGVAEVAGDDARALLKRSTKAYAEAHLTTANARLAVMLFVSAQVVHVGYVRQAEVAATHGATHMTHGIIGGVLEKRGTSSLGGTIAFDDLITEDAAKEGEDFRRERCGAGNADQQAVQTQVLLHSVEYHAIIEPVSVISAGKVCCFRSDTAVEEETSNRGRIGDLRRQGLMDLVQPTHQSSTSEHTSEERK